MIAGLIWPGSGQRVPESHEPRGPWARRRGASFVAMTFARSRSTQRAPDKLGSVPGPI